MKRQLILIQLLALLVLASTVRAEGLSSDNEHLRTQTAKALEDIEERKKREQAQKKLKAKKEEIDEKIKSLKPSLLMTRSEQDPLHHESFNGCSKGLIGALNVVTSSIAEAAFVVTNGGVFTYETTVLATSYLLRKAGVEIDDDEEDPYKRTKIISDKIREIAHDAYIGDSHEKCAKVERTLKGLEQKEDELLGEIKELQEQKEELTLDKISQVSRNDVSNNLIEARVNARIEELSVQNNATER